MYIGTHFTHYNKMLFHISTVEKPWSFWSWFIFRPLLSTAAPILQHTFQNWLKEVHKL
jgi:hypothetical protein